MSQTELILGLFLASMVGGVLPLFARDSNRVLHLLVCISAGFFLGVVFLHLLPEMTHQAEGDDGIWAWVLGGLLGVLILDLGIFGSQGHAAVGWATLLGLSVHAAATGLSLGILRGVAGTLGFAMLAHKFGEAFSLVSALRFSVPSRRITLIPLALFSMITPVAIWAGAAIGARSDTLLVAHASAVAAGSFLYVAVGDLLPEVFHEAHDRGLKLVLLLAGVGFAVLVGGGHLHATPLLEGTAHETSKLLAWASQAWSWFEAAAPFLLLGFFVAGLVHVWLPRGWLRRVLGRDDARSVVTASLIGAPLPLCSCSVLPTAVALRKDGASKGATVAFLVATPETGIDSVAVSAALLDPFLTVARPIGAVLSAILAGLATMLGASNAEQPGSVAGADCAASLCGTSCSQSGGSETDRKAVPSLDAALRFAFGDLLDDIAPSLLLGIAVSALFAVFLPVDFLGAPWASGFAGLLLAVAIGVPIYVCASASTPIAAALILKGLSPGAALVFLLVGPATNVASFFVLRRALGGRTVVIYLVTLVGTALALGLLTNWIYTAWSLPPVAASAAHADEGGIVHTLAAVVLALLCAASLWRRTCAWRGRAGVTGT